MLTVKEYTRDRSALHESMGGSNDGHGTHWHRGIFSGVTRGLAVRRHVCL